MKLLKIKVEIIGDVTWFDSAAKLESYFGEDYDPKEDGQGDVEVTALYDDDTHESWTVSNRLDWEVMLDRLVKEDEMGKYLLADLNYLENDVLAREIRNAASSESVDDYRVGAGWQSWMEDFTDAEGGEECSEAELAVIEEMQRLIWVEAHEKKTERINLRVSPALKYEAERRALEEARSLNSYIEWLIMNDK